jgi:predicted DNA binding CopG/RHH family protein
MQPQNRTDTDNQKSTDDTEKWENQELGADPEHAQKAPKAREKDLNALIDQALELELISIRLQKGLVEAFKELADLEGVGYQPLMRQVLTRHIREQAKEQ